METFKDIKIEIEKNNFEDNAENCKQIKKELNYGTDEVNLEFGMIKDEQDVMSEIFQAATTSCCDEPLKTAEIKSVNNTSRNIEKKSKNNPLTKSKRKQKTVKNYRNKLNLDIGTIKVELNIVPEIFETTTTNNRDISVKTEVNNTRNTSTNKHYTPIKLKSKQKHGKINKDENDEQVTYLCETCNKYFSSWSQLKSHEAAHIRKRIGKFSCEKCDKSFSFKCNLDRHMVLHDETRRLSCIHCDKKFKRKYMLLEHIRSHKGIKPFSCENCQLQFTTKAALIQHNEVHSKKNFECSICGKLFRRKFNLIQHERSHNNEKPYTCTECHKKFAYKCNLKNHLCEKED